MKTTTNWILNYLEPRVGHDALMEAFPKIGLEIEESEPLSSGGYFVDLNVLANRPDCLGMIGIAREVAAHLGLKLKLPEVAREGGSDGSSPFVVEIRNPELCPRYAARAISNVKVAPSPAWLSEALISIGQRSINNVVDITNFVMFEFGEPLHAFDFDRVAGKKVVVRTLAEAESLELLGGKTIDAGKAGANPTLVICDESTPLALAGIMGGKSSETRETTTTILLEAAHFNPENIRKTRKRLELSTESSYRFERGVDPNFAIDHALARATSLICELAGGKPVGSPVDAYPVKREPKVFTLTSRRVSEYLGSPIDDATISTSLKKLDMRVGDDLSVTVPTWRFDVTDPVVLIEDVARSVGYDSIPTQPTSQTPTLGSRGPIDALRQAVANYLSSAGFFETRSPALLTAESVDSLDAEADRGSVVRLQNPMTRDHAVLRTRLLPSLVRVAERNARRGATTARFYEIDKVYRRDQSARANEKPGAIEPFLIAGIAGGLLSEFDWSGRNTAITFFDLKGSVEDILDLCGTTASFAPAKRSGFSKDATAAIVVAGRPIGYIGEIDKSVIDVGKTSFKLFGFEIELDAMLSGYSRIAAHASLARTPSVVRDLAFVVKATETFSEIEAIVREGASEILESVRLVDIYKGQPIPAGHQSLAMRLTFRAADRTLTAEEVQVHVDRVVSLMKEEFDAALRA